MAILVLSIITILVYRDTQNNRLIITENSVEITGGYGEKIPIHQLKTVQKVTQLPKLKLKTNGFSAGGIKKGYFKTEENEKIKLLVNTNHKLYLLLVTTEGKKLYYSATEQPLDSLYNKLKETITQ